MSFISSLLLCLSPITAMIAVVLQRNHILMSLLAFEAMILSLVIMSISCSSSINQMEMFLVLIILTFGACEASLGLACLIAMARSFGNDMISSSSLSKC